MFVNTTLLLSCLHHQHQHHSTSFIMQPQPTLSKRKTTARVVSQTPTSTAATATTPITPTSQSRGNRVVDQVLPLQEVTVTLVAPAAETAVNLQTAAAVNPQNPCRRCCTPPPQKRNLENPFLNPLRDADCPGKKRQRKLGMTHDKAVDQMRALPGYSIARTPF